MPAVIKIYDLVGLLNLEVENAGSIDLRNLRSGAYLAVAEGKDGVSVIRRILKI